METCSRQSELELRKPQERPQTWPHKLPRVTLCALLFAQSPNLPANIRAQGVRDSGPASNSVQEAFAGVRYAH
eukprot:12140264-Alexandrium_andersonii.AAC.1